MTSLPISLSTGVSPTVKVNDIVKAGQVIAKKVSQKEYIINLVKEFSVPNDKVRKYLRKKPGDIVNTGDVLAVKRSFWGLSEDKLLSKVSGIFTRYERDTGNLVISTNTGVSYADIVSPVDGIVTICDNDKIVIGTEKDVYPVNKGTGGSASGEVFVLEKAFSNDNGSTGSEISLYYALDSRAVGKVIVGTSFPRDLLIKCIGMEASGIVGTGISDEDMEYLAQRKMQVPIIETDDKTIEYILQWKRKKIYLNSPEKVMILLHA